MKVSVKDLHVWMELKNNGIELEIRDNKGEHQGDLIVTKSKVIWCNGRTQRKNGKSISLDEFIEFMNKR